MYWSRAVAYLQTHYQDPTLTTAQLAQVAAGWQMKYSLVCRAAFTQGFALPKQPVRGNSRTGPGVKPGWQWNRWLTD